MNRAATVAALLGGIALSVCWLWREKPAPRLEAGPAASLLPIAEKLTAIIIPDYPTTGLTLAEAVEHLRLKSHQFDKSANEPWNRGINIVIIAGGDRKLPTRPMLPLHDVPLGEALRHITGLVDLKSTIEPHAVAIRAAQDERTPSHGKKPSIQGRMERTILPTVQFQDASLEEAVEYLRVNRGCLDSSEGEIAVAPLNFVIYLREGAKRSPVSLYLRDIPLSEALRYCAEISDVKLRYDPFAVMITDREAAGSGVALAGIPADSPILPEVRLSGATLTEALEFIRLKSRELDPDHREVLIAVKSDSQNALIDLWLKSIPSIEALRYIAELSGHQLSFDGRSYVLTPKNMK